MRFAYLLVALTLALGACESPVEVGPVDYDETVDFSSYESFAWISDEPMKISGERPPRLTPLAETHVKNAIKDALTAKGYAFQIDPEDADFVVAFTVGSRDQIDVRSYPRSYRGGWGWGGRYWGRSTTTSRIELRQPMGWVRAGRRRERCTRCTHEST